MTDQTPPAQPVIPDSDQPAPVPSVAQPPEADPAALSFEEKVRLGMPLGGKTHFPDGEPIPAHLQTAPPELLRVPPEALLPPPGDRPKRHHLPWDQVAEMLAGGSDPREIAAAVHCEPERIWIALHRSRRLKAKVERAVRRRRLLSGLRLGDLAEQILVPLTRPGAPVDASLIRWLGEAAGLGVASDDAGQPLTLADRIATAAAPPLRPVRRKSKQAPASADRPEQSETGQGKPE